ncbi:MAG: tetratricopeptide repeat protein, partial [Acidobacteriaceae bacterium]|nr:tetratricopeptide repeat protein [Acidobacteriaceae bacterium]
MKTTILCTPVLLVSIAAAQPSPDRIVSAMQDRQLAEYAMRLNTDDRITLYQQLSEAKTENLHYQVLLAGAFIQKMRDTTDYGYLDRADKVLQRVLSADSANYEALRLRTEIELERHHFKQAVEYSQQLTKTAPGDAWNWGTLGDAYIELGDYNRAADAYQKMINLRPNLSSYNRAAHYRFLTNDLNGAIEIMKQAIESGSTSPENVAWCYVELGAYYLKAGRLADAEYAYTNALRTFPKYHPAYAGLGKVRIAQGKTDDAVQQFLRAQV